MKISHNWLRQLVDLPQDVTWQDIARRLTLAGIEVEGVSQVGKGLSGVVVAEVRGRRRHPQADKLTLVDVFDGESVTQVVCGAPNVPEPGEPGHSPLVAWARPGATLPSGMTLGAREVRGVLSPGMLCAEDELGLSEDHGGILVMAPEDLALPSGERMGVGGDFAGLAGLPDVVWELNVLANRPDLLGHVGVAREVAALYAQGSFAAPALRLPEPRLMGYRGPTPTGVLAGVEVLDPLGCSRYLARVIQRVRVGGSPLWVRLLLRRLGVRSISNVVDATNLAMLEWGQPLHAFDLGRLSGRRIIVRRAGAGERLRTLDGVERELTASDVVISDGARPVALAGVMGGQDSEVVPETQELLLESAYFEPALVRRTARRMRLHTEASHRFERGTDPNDGLSQASARCAALIVQLAGGLVAPEPVDVYPVAVKRQVVLLRPARTDAVLGVHVPAAAQVGYLQALGMGVSGGPEGAVGGSRLWEVEVPTHRPDLSREIDLIEEIARLHGFDRVPARLPALREGQGGGEGASAADLARDLCCGLGLSEIQTYSFVAPERLRVLGFGEQDRRGQPLVLHNPLREELSALRTQIVIGLLEALRHNLSHGVADVRLFEVAEVFWRRPGAATSDLPEERTRVAGVLSGRRDHWLKGQPGDALDVYDVRGVVEELLRGLGLELREVPGPAPEVVQPADGGVFIRAAAPGEVPWLHPGVAAAVCAIHTGEIVGEFGEVHPDLRAKLGIEAPAFAFELDVPPTVPGLRRFVQLSRYPAVSRDLSFFVDEAVPAGQLVGTLRSGGEALLQEVQVMDDYREPGKVPQGKKGILLTLVYRSPDRTLLDEEVRKAHDNLVKHLQGRFQVELR